MLIFRSNLFSSRYARSLEILRFSINIGEMTENTSNTKNLIEGGFINGEKQNRKPSGGFSNTNS